MVPADVGGERTYDAPVVVGHEAHIVAEEDDGPRGDASMPVGERNAYANLLLLCPTHHALVDKDHGIHFSVIQLHQMKDDHEALVERRRRGVGDGREAADRRRQELLLEAASASRGRLIARWAAAGVDAGLAQVLADDDTVGNPARLGRVLPPTGLLVLEGDFGSGKSVTAERIFGADIAAALDDAQAPAPVYLVAKSIAGSLMEAARAATAGLGDPGHHGLRLVVDGLDEPGPARAAELLSEARSLTFTWAATRVVVTARPGLDLQDSERLAHPLLGDTEAALLAQRLGGSTRILESVSGSAKGMLRLPLFLIVAVLRRLGGAPVPTSQGMFLEALADAALDRTQAPTEKATDAMLTLARLATRSGSSVPAWELGGRDAVRWALETRLVVRADRSLRFALPVVEQYFAARSALEAGLDEADLADLRVLDRWRDPLTLAVTIGSWQQVSTLLDALTPRYPGLTSWLLATALPDRWLYYPTARLPSAQECARRVHHALTTWVDALGPVGALLDLTDHAGRVRMVGTAVRGDVVTLGLLVAESEQADTTQPPAELGLTGDAAPDGFEWDLVQTDRPPADFAVWPWQSAQRLVGDAIEVVLQEQLLDLPNSKPFQNERHWQMAKGVTRRAARDQTPLMRSEVLRAAEDLLARMTAEEWSCTRSLSSREDIAAFAGELANGTLSKNFLLTRPYPAVAEPDTMDVSDAQSGESLCLLVEQVYTNALAIYQGLVECWFPRFAPMLGIACMLPILIQGQLRPAPGRDPDFAYDMEPLPSAGRSRAEVRPWEWSMEQIGDIVSSLMERIHQTQVLIASRRPGAEGWAHPRTKDVILPIWDDTPAITLAYQWLREDLQGLRMIERLPPSSGY
jgi:hypothetical protein